MKKWDIKIEKPEDRAKQKSHFLSDHHYCLRHTQVNGVAWASHITHRHAHYLLFHVK